MPKGCGGESDVCRSFAAYGTATKAGQKPTLLKTPTAPHVLISLQSPSTFPSPLHQVGYRFRLTDLRSLKAL